MTPNLLHRIARQNHTKIPFTLDGEPCEGRDGDTILTAILTIKASLRITEFTHTPRAGFCQMGACQDCWVETENGDRLRACTTRLTAGLHLRTTP